MRLPPERVGARTEWARALGIVFLGASLVACFDSKRISFISESNLPDAGAASGASRAPPSRATGGEPAAIVAERDEAVPGISGATALGTADGVPLDPGTTTGAVDAGAPDAAP